MTAARRPSPESTLARSLLAFAIKRIRRETIELTDSYMDPATARIEDKAIAKEVRENHEWLKRARKAVKR